jgi:hypothetical protein
MADTCRAYGIVENTFCFVFYEVRTEHQRKQGVGIIVAEFDDIAKQFDWNPWFEWGERFYVPGS